MTWISAAVALLVLAFIFRTFYKVWRIDRCPVCYWGKIDVLKGDEIKEAIEKGTFITALKVFTRVHLRCGRCREVYRREADGTLERTELPIAGEQDAG